MEQNKIDFIGVGVPKAATTWIGECLAQHPEVLFSSEFFIKELNFFNMNYSKGINWYLSLFPKTNKIKGEFSPTYFWDNSVAGRIKKHFPNTKIIISLRNPIDMIYSFYWYDASAIRLEKPINFDQAVKQGHFNSINLEYGSYAKRLKEYYSLFPKENILVILYDDIKTKPNNTIQNMYNFLGVDKKFVPEIVFKKVNKTKKTRSEILKKAAAQFINLSYLLGLKQLKKIKPITQWLASENFLDRIYKQLNYKKFKYPPMKQKTRKKLFDYYKADIKKTEKIINRDLSGWK